MTTESTLRTHDQQPKALARSGVAYARLEIG